jgi:hypothetical protein
MPEDCSEIAPSYTAPATKARITNHRDLLPGLDGRSSGARRYRDLVQAYAADMGGLSNLSEVKLGLLRRLAAASVLAEALEVKAANGEAVDIATFCNLASTTVRIASRVGLERYAHDITPPSVADYVKHLELETDE